MATTYTDIKMVFGFDLEGLYTSGRTKNIISKIKKAIKASGGDPSEYIHHVINSVGVKSYAVGQDVCKGLCYMEYSILGQALLDSDINGDNTEFLDKLKKIIGTDLYKEMVENANNSNEPSLLTLVSSVEGKKIRKSKKKAKKNEITD